MHVKILLPAFLFFCQCATGQRPGVNTILVHTKLSKQENYDHVSIILERRSANDPNTKHPMNDSIINSRPFDFYDFNVFDENNDETYFISFHIQDSLVTIRGFVETPSLLVMALTQDSFNLYSAKRIYMDPHRKSDMGRAFKNAISFANLIDGRKQYLKETRKTEKKKK